MRITGVLLITYHSCCSPKKDGLSTSLPAYGSSVTSCCSENKIQTPYPDLQSPAISVPTSLSGLISCSLPLTHSVPVTLALFPAPSHELVLAAGSVHCLFSVLPGEYSGPELCMAGSSCLSGFSSGVPSPKKPNLTPPPCPLLNSPAPCHYYSIISPCFIFFMALFTI